MIIMYLVEFRDLIIIYWQKQSSNCIKVKALYQNGERYIKFYVFDTGIGININDMQKLFTMGH